jgi:YVTN family beta-propeller protein
VKGGNITVGESPSGIAVDLNNDVVYVANSKDDTVSVINGSNKVIDTIKVGHYPNSVAVNFNNNKTYVANSNDGTVSVINGSDKVIDIIKVGENPNSIAVNPNNNKTYVANSNDGTVSVINGSDKVIDIIKVGENPNSIAVNPNNDIVYVANSDSDSISIIDGITEQLLEGVTFDVSPPNSGHIKCNGKEFATNIYFRIKFSSQCEAVANNGFIFSSWVENYGPNSSLTLKTAPNPDSPFSFLFGSEKSKNNSSILNEDLNNSSILDISYFGSFTSNFKEIPPPIAREYWIGLYGIMISSVIGWFVPSIARWINVKRQGGHLGKYLKYIDSLNSKFDQNNNEHLQALASIKNTITDAYARGAINEFQYGILKDKLSTRR